GLAVHNFEETYKLLPSGAWNFANPAIGGTIYVEILPDLEQAALDAVARAPAGGPRQAGAVPLSVLRCPSDDHPDTYGGQGTQNYAASRGPTDLDKNAACPCDYEWKQFAVAPLDDPNNFAGPFTRVGTQLPVNSISDGLSNTIFFGEVRPGCSS